VSTVGLLTAVVEAEHAAVYGYGVLGARLDDATRRIAVQAYDVHRSRRDRAVAALAARGVDAPVPLPVYDVTVADRAAALALAVRLEEGVGQRWRDLVGGTDEPDLRPLAVSCLSETAVRAARWRRLAGLTPVTVPLPGT
jgi:hypothetical protein